MDSLLLDALKCKNKRRPPIWIMRQAGRYMPEYRALRSKYSFKEMYHHPELAAEVTLLPLRSFALDAAILFSDILVIPEAFGINVEFEERIGPQLSPLIQTSQDVENLPKPDVKDKLAYITKTIHLLKPQLNVPLLGFCGAPFTIASYLIEGGSSKDLKKTKQWMFREPASFHRLLTKIMEATADYLLMQIEAGVNAIQIFDSWAYFLGHKQFQEFSLSYLGYLIEILKDTNIPIILFCRGSSVFAPLMASLKPAAISLDWQADLLEIRKVISKNIAIQGNLDPDVLYADPTSIRKEANRLLDGMKGNPGYIFNLGHGIHPDTPVDAVKTLIDCVRSYET